MKKFIEQLIAHLETQKGWCSSRTCGAVTDEIRKFAEEYKLFGNSEQVKCGWIPCSVELPKYMERVITCDEKWNIHVFPCDGKYFLDEYCKRITENHERYYVPAAWMQLPEPYRKEGE